MDRRKLIFLAGFFSLILIAIPFILADAPTIGFVSPTPSNGSSQTNTDIYLNLSTTTTGDHYTFVNFDDSLVLWLRMDDVNSSGDPVDLSRFSNNGSLNGSVTINSSGGYWGNGSNFPGGASNYIDLGTPGSLEVNSNYTLAAWIKPTGTISDGVIKRGNAFSSSLRMWKLDYTTSFSGAIRFYIGNSSGASQNIVSNTGSVPANQWSFVACGINETDYLQCWVNGVLQTQTALRTLTGPAYTTKNTFIGSVRTGTATFNGSIDEVFVFNRSLSTAELQTLYNATAYQYGNNFTNLAEGSHTFQGFSVNTNGGENETTENNVSISHGPALTIYSPTNTSYVTSSIVINFSASDIEGVDTKWFDNGTGNTTYTSEVTQIFGNGGHTIIFYSNDSLGENSSQSVSFDVDVSSPPLVTINSPTNTTYGSSDFPLLVNITLDKTGSDVMYSTDGGVNNVSASSTDGLNYNVSISSLTEGAYTLEIYANDSFGNRNDTENVSFDVDINPPLVYLESPSSDYINTNRTPSLTFNVSDTFDSSLDCELFLNNSLGVQKGYDSNSSVLNATSTSFIVNDTLLSGTYNWWVNCSDAVNSNVSSMRNFSVALIPVARWDTVPYQRLNANETLNLGVVAFSNAGIANVTFNISGQGYSSGQKFAYNMTYNPESDVYEYWAVLNASEFVSDGNVNVEAIVYGNDGGIRDKNTDGGGFGLDGLNLTVNPNGTMLQYIAVVDPVLGNDATGVSSITKSVAEASPYETITAAMGAIEDAAGDGGGSTVYLREGVHNSSGSGTSLTTSSEWLVVKADNGLNRSDVTVTRIVGGDPTFPGGNYKVKIEGVVFKNLGYLASSSPIIAASDENITLWLDNVEMTGIHRSESVGPIGNNIGRTNAGLWLTNITSHDFNSLIDNPNFVRGCNVYNSSGDFGQKLPMAVNCNISDMDPAYPIPDIINATFYNGSTHSSGYKYVIEKTGAFVDYNGSWGAVFAELDNGQQYAIIDKISDDAIYLNETNVESNPGYLPSNGEKVSGFISTGNHVDLWQWFNSATGDSPNNVLLYNLRATGMRYQGLFARPGGLQYENETAEGVAFVNLFIQMQSPIHKSNGGGGTSAYSYTTNHLIMWHVTYLGNGTEPDGTSLEPSFSLTDRDGVAHFRDLSFKGNLFENLLRTNDSGGTTDYSMFAHNHFIDNSSLNQVPHGTDETDGNTTLDDFGRPSNSSSILIDRVLPLVIGIDAGNGNRNSLGGDIGSYEYSSSGDLDNTSPSVNLQSPDDGSSTTSVVQSFNATFTDNIQLANSTFYLWNSTGDVVNQTISAITGTSNSTNLSVTLPYEGSFNWNYEVYDNSSNSAFASSNYSLSYSVSSPSDDTSSSSPSSGSGSTLTGNEDWTTTYRNIGQTLEGSRFIQKNLGVKERIAFNLGGEIHSVGVLEINGTRIKVRVESIPIDAWVDIGGSEKFDVDRDEYYDLSVTVNEVVDGVADVWILYMHEEVPNASSDNAGNETTVNAGGDNANDEGPSSGGYWYNWKIWDDLHNWFAEAGSGVQAYYAFYAIAGALAIGIVIVLVILIDKLVKHIKWKRFARKVKVKSGRYIKVR